MIYNFDEIIDRHGTYSSKWDAGKMALAKGWVPNYDERSIPLFTADMDLPSPQPVVDAMHRVADFRMYGYTAIDGAPGFHEAIVGWFKRHHGWEIDPATLVYVDGTVKAIALAIRAFTQPGDGVIITRPVYGPFTGSVENNGRTVVNSPLIDRDGYYTMDFEDIERKAQDPKNKMFLLCNPHNPTGRVWTPEELRTLSEICVRNGVLLVSDEVHCDILRRGVKFTPALCVADPENTIALNAINKTFNLAGLHCSHAVIPNARLREQYAKLADCPITPFAIAALMAAYNEGDEWYEQAMDYIDGNIDWVLSFLKERLPLAKCRRPEGTYVMWIDFSAYGLSPEEQCDLIYHKADVLLENGSCFDPNGTSGGYERICTPSPRPLIVEAMERIADTFDRR